MYVLLGEFDFSLMNCEDMRLIATINYEAVEKVAFDNNYKHIIEIYFRSDMHVTIQNPFLF